VQAVTAPKGRQAVALPGVCVRATPCQQDPSGDCFRCRTNACTELQDLRNVPIRVSVRQAAGAAVADPPIILTNRFGTVVPQAQVDDCASPIVVHAEVVGRVDTGVDFPVTCVDPIDFDPKPTDRVDVGGGLTAVNVAAIGTIPEVRGANGVIESRARVAVLLNGAMDRTVLEIYEADGRSLVLAEELKLSDGTGRPERGLGLLGFHYKLSEKRNPMLAVVTARSNEPVVRLFRYDERAVPGQRLVLLDETHDAKCANDGCTALQECCGCDLDPNVCDTGCTCDGLCDITTRPCQKKLTLTQAMPPLPMAVADRNGDGLADFSFATDREFQMYTYYSSPGFTDRPAPLDGVCQCSAFGRGMPAYEMISLGGPPASFTGPNVDLLMGDGTGAYVRYASEDRVEGLPCSTTSTVNDPCEGGLTCRELCPGDRSSGRCVELCNLASSTVCKTSPLRSKCLPKDPGGDIGYCGGPGLACRSLNSVWRLTTIHDVAKGLLNGDDVEDAIAVGAGSPVPSSGSGGSVRIMYGSSTDLTKIDDLSADLRAASFVELTARRLSASEDAQSPRGVELGDFNGDDILDIAAIYTSSEEIRIWLGGVNLVPGEIGQAPGSAVGGRVKLNECADTCPSRSRCFPFQRFAVADLDADGKAEVIAVCVPDVDGPKPTLKWFTPETL